MSRPAVDAVATVMVLGGFLLFVWSPAAGILVMSVGTIGWWTARLLRR